MPRVTVLGLNFAPEPTGIAPYTTGLVRGLVERGFEVRVLTTRPHYPQWTVDPLWNTQVPPTVSGLDVRRVRHYVPSRPTGVRRAISEISFGALSVTKGWRRPDLVICTSPALIATSMAMARVHATPRRPAVGLVVQDLYASGSKEVGGHGGLVTSALSAVEGWALRKADGVVVIHERFRKNIGEGYSIDEGKISVIRNWTHVDRVAPVEDTERWRVRAEFGWRPEEFVVLHTGAMGEKQDLMNVVEAAWLAEARGGRIRFVLVGNGGQRQSLVREAHGCVKIDFREPVAPESYNELLAAADLLLVNEKPGVSEMAVPSKLTSYFSSGVATLAATDVGSTTSEEIEASGAGLVTAPGSPEGLLRAISSLADRPDFARSLGKNGPIYCTNVLSERVALDSYASWAMGLLS